MGSSATLQIGSLELLDSKSSWESLVMTLFTEEDRVAFIYRDAEDNENGYIDDNCEYEFFYCASLQVIKDRLEVMGFTYKKAAEAYQLVLSEKLRDLRQSVDNDLLPFDPEDIEERKSRIKFL